MTTGTGIPMAVIAMLADGELHSGEALAAKLGVTRTAVWKQVRELVSLGLDVQAVAGQGYRLVPPLELLDVESIRQAAGSPALHTLNVFGQLDSTNTWLLAQPMPPRGRLDACLAETQTAGRGRRGRSWAAPLGGGLYLSMAWQFDPRPPDFPALSLATGVAVRAALADLGLTTVQLKWPNDLVVDDGKLGGVLVELRGEADGPSQVVIGVGINVALPAQAREAVAPNWGRGPVDLHEIIGQPVSRNQLAGRLIARTADMLVRFQDSGFASFRNDFLQADYLRGRALSAPSPTSAGAASAHRRSPGRVHGTGDGVDADGALRVATAQGVVRIASGEVSVGLRR